MTPPPPSLHTGERLAAGVLVLIAIAFLLARPITHLLDVESLPARVLGCAGFAVSVLSLHIGVLTLLGAVGALFARKPRLAAGALAVGLIGVGPFLWSLRPRLDLPSITPPTGFDSDATLLGPPDRPGLRVMELNALFMNTQHERIIDAVRTADPDLLLLEEYTQHLDDALRPGVAGALPYVFSRVRPNERGQAIYSRVPLEDAREITLDAGSWSAPALAARIRWRGEPIDLLAVHLPGIDHPAQNYRAMRELARLAGAAPGDLILAGDFNFTPETLQHALLTGAGLRDAHDAAGFGRGATHPGTPLPAWCNPGVRNDMLFTRGGLLATSSQVLDPVGSDHVPMLVTLTRN